MLTPDQVLSFHVNGFLAVSDPVTDAAELRRMVTVYDKLFAERAGRNDGNQFDLAGSDEDDRPAAVPQILDPERYAPEIAGPYLEVVDRIAKQLLGDLVKAEIFHAILKPGGSPAPTPWHQDEAYWSPAFQYQSMSIWMALQDATVESGCMWFAPGSHEWDVLEHRSIGGDPSVHGLELVDQGVITTPIACPLPAGGIVIHRNRTAHYAGPNNTTQPRRALIMGASLPERRYPVARRFPWNERKHTRREERAQAAGRRQSRDPMIALG